MGKSRTATLTLRVAVVLGLIVCRIPSHGASRLQAASSPTINSFTASPSAITVGQSATLSWTVSNSRTVSIDQGIGNVARSGSIVVSPRATTTYTLTAKNYQRTVTRSVTVSVAAPLQVPVISTFVATPASITAGQTSTLSWAVSNASAVTINGTAVAVSGSMTVAPIQTTIYTLTATNAAGRSTKQTTVTVTAADTTPPVISNGQPTGALPAGTTSVTLSVATNEAATCGYATAAGTAYGSMTRFASTGGTAHSTPLPGLVAGAYTYYVRCSDASGNTDTADYPVAFSIPPAPPAGGFCAVLPPPTGTVVSVSTPSALVNAVASATPGTTILLANGTYAGINLVFRTSNVTLRSQSGDRDAAIIDGNYTVGEIISILAAHVTIADLTIQRAQYHPIHLGGGGDYAQLYNLHIIDGGEQFVKENPDTSGHFNDYGTIACSLLELTPAGRNYVQGYTAAATGFACYTGGIDGHQARGWSVRDNTIKDIYCDTGLAEHAIHFWNSSRDTVVERNVMINDARGVGFGLGSTSTVRTYPDDPLAGTGLAASSVGHIGGVVRNNFVYADTPRFDTGIGLEQAWNASVFHNTVFTTVGGLGIDVRYPNSNPAVQNNLVTPGIDLRDGGSLRASGGNVAAASGMFVNPAVGDLHLVAGAAAIGHGVNLNGLVPTDIDGGTRDSTPDAGADEYGVTLARALSGIFDPVHAAARRVAEPNFAVIEH